MHEITGNGFAAGLATVRLTPFPSDSLDFADAEGGLLTSAFPCTAATVMSVASHCILIASLRWQYLHSAVWLGLCTSSSGSNATV